MTFTFSDPGGDRGRQCDDDGRTTWDHDSAASDRFIVEITDVERSQEAMTRTLSRLLRQPLRQP